VKRLRSGIIILFLVVFSILGLTRLQFETDILEILPKGIKGVDALKTFRTHFDEDQQVIVLLESADDEVYEDDVALIAESLREHLTTATIEYKSPFEENPAGFAKALARVWTYAPTSDVETFTQRLKDQNTLETYLEQRKQEIRDSFDQSASTMASYDPLGFLQHPSIVQLSESDFSYQSEDGKAHILLIATKNLDHGYKNHEAWVQLVRGQLDHAISKNELELSYTLTGGPVYSAEIGSSMEKDMTGTITLTSILVGLLFLLIQRNIGQLFMIGSLLGLTFLITLGIGGWIFGKLNLVSVGFAAILLGLVIDYAVVIARESVGQQTTATPLRKSIAPSILWAALTTAVVFGILTFSTFTGVRQLGGLIVIGLITGSLTMLYFTPLFLKRFPTKKAQRSLSPIFLSKKPAILLLTFSVGAAVSVFSFKGAPKINFDLSMAEPATSEAARTFEKIQSTFPAWSDDNLQILASADSLEELHAKTRETEKRLHELKQQGLILEYQWPDSLAPNIQAFHSNKDHWKGARENKEQIFNTLTKFGFNERGTALDKAIFDELTGELFESISVHDSTADDLVGLFFDADDQGGYFFSGRFRAAKSIDPETIKELQTIEQPGVTITGWPALQAILLPMVQKDFYMIFLPAAGALLLALLIVFRSWKDTFTSVAILITVLVLTNALAVALNQSWNFLSGMAIPLIIGTGIDYSIHLIFALRRSKGDLSEVWNSVGKAILFCGLSTAIGFGSLLFASNEMLKSMGLLCSIGVLLTAFLSVLVIPGLWQWSHHRRLTKS